MQCALDFSVSCRTAGLGAFIIRAEYFGNIAVFVPVYSFALNDICILESDFSADIKPEELAAIKCPVLVTAGSKDLISVEHTTLIADSPPDSELIIFKGASHSSYIKRNPRLGKAMLDFMVRHGY
mgnify:CR=1 FL=1